MLTIRQLLSLPLLSKAQLVAGEKGIDREVLWAAAVDIPQASEWVRAGELLLTTFYGLRDDAEAQISLCARLADKNVAGMIVATGTYIAQVPEALCRVANEAGFPIIELPWNVPFE